MLLYGEKCVLRARGGGKGEKKKGKRKRGKGKANFTRRARQSPNFTRRCGNCRKKKSGERRLLREREICEKRL